MKILETKNEGFVTAADKKRVAEVHLKASLKAAEDINNADSEIISEHKSDKKRLRNKVKVWKFVAGFTSGIAAILGAKIALSTP